MRVEIIKANKLVKGKPGDVVDCDASPGNAAACMGLVKVVSHEKRETASQPKACVVKNKTSLRAKQESEGDS